MAESEDPRAAPVVTNVVFMGMGEPLHNIDAVLAAVDILTDPRGLALSHNKVTVSTSGLVPEMERYLRESRGSLAVSLSATTDEIRSWIMPINRKYNLERLIGALAERFRAKARGGASAKCSSSTSCSPASTTRRRTPTACWTSPDRVL